MVSTGSWFLPPKFHAKAQQLHQNLLCGFASELCACVKTLSLRVLNYFVTLSQTQNRIKERTHGSEKRDQEVQRRAQRWRQSGKEERVKIQVPRRCKEGSQKV